MLSRHNRYFAVASFLLLATPLVCGILFPDNPQLIRRERRRRSPAPAVPDSVDALFGLPAEIDAFLRDRFGLRQEIIRAQRILTKPLHWNGNSADVLVGLHGRMFYLGDEMVRQSAGLVVRDRKITEAADLLASIRDALARRGIPFVVAVPPNSSSVYQEDLPDWARNHGKKTEYDLFFEDLAKRQIKAVDLRPAMRTAKTTGPIYFKYDTHWAPRGALAGFNAIVEKAGHRDWRLDPESVLKPLAPHKGGDLARMLGVQDEVSEPIEDLKPLSGVSIEYLSNGMMRDSVFTSGRPGPTVMVIGDSFTYFYFPSLLLRKVGRAIWLSHGQCNFDWRWIDRLHPDEVWWVATERLIVCRPSPHLIGFHGSGRSTSG